MKRFAPLCIRAAAGAFAGFAVVGLISLIAVDSNGFGARAETAVLKRFLVELITAGATLGAVVAVLFGTAEVGGRTGAVIKGMAIGGLAGVLTGLSVGSFAASNMDAPAKSVVFLGIFAGLALGVAVGGIVGAALPVMPVIKPTVLPSKDVGDRMLDAGLHQRHRTDQARDQGSGAPAMAEALNTFADFIGDFPYVPGWTEDPKVALPGKDVAALLANGLRKRGFTIGKFEAVDYGHFLDCESGGFTFEISVTVDDPWQMKRWTVQCPSTASWWTSITGQTDHAAHRNLLMAIHDVLSRSNRISDLRWFPSVEPADHLRDQDANSSPLRHTKTAI
jgi:hypothetical protein